MKTGVRVRKIKDHRKGRGRLEEGGQGKKKRQKEEKICIGEVKREWQEITNMKEKTRA